MPDNSEEEILLNVNISVNGQDQLAEIGAQMDEMAQKIADDLAGVNESLTAMEDAFARMGEAIAGGASASDAFGQMMVELEALGPEGEFVAGVMENLAVVLEGDVTAAARVVFDNMGLVKDAFNGTQDESVNLIDELVKLQAEFEGVAAGAGGTIPPINNLDAALADSNGSMQEYTAGLEFIAKALNNTKNNIPQLVEAQLAAVSAALDTAKAFLAAAQAGNAEESAISALQTTVHSLAGRLDILQQAQQAVNIVLGASKATIDPYNQALIFLSDNYAKLNTDIGEETAALLQQTEIALKAAQALLDFAVASGADADTLKTLQGNVTALTENLDTLRIRQEVFNKVFAEAAPVLSVYEQALLSVGEALVKLNTNIGEDVAAQAQQTHAALYAAQALLEYAQDSGQSAEAIAVLEQNVASLMEKLAFQREQVQVASDAWVTFASSEEQAERSLSLLSGRLDTNANVLRAQIEDEILATEATLRLTRELLLNAEAVNNTGDAYNALLIKLNTYNDKLMALRGASAQLSQVMGDMGITTYSLGQAILDVGDKYTTFDSNIRENINKQLEQIRTSQDAITVLRDYASANGYASSVVQQLGAQYEALNQKAAALQRQQQLLNEVFGQEAPEMLRAYDEGLQYLAEQLGNASLKTSEEMQKELESIQARIQAAEALWKQADAAGAAQSALNRMRDTIDSLTDRETILKSAIQQVNEANLETPVVANEAKNALNDEADARQQNAFMMLMFVQRVLQLAQQFIALGAAADTSLAGIQAEMGLTQQATDGLATQLQAMATSTGYGLNTLADGLKTIMEAGFNASEGLQVLQASAELARATSTDLATTTTTLSSVMDTFHLSGAQAAQTANQLMVGAQAAHQTVQAFATSLSQVAEDAAAAHVSFAEVASAEAVLSVRFGNASTAASTLSTLLHAVSLDASTVSNNVQKAGLSFDAAKFQTLDWAGKLEYLNTITHGNAQEIQQLVGGSTLLQQAMNGVGLSTQQLATNAIALGLSFNAAHYNSLSLAEKLQYLLQVSGGNEKTFQALMGGAANLNGAFQNLRLTTSDVAAQAQHLGLAFDATHFKGESLIQKLRDLWAISGQNVGVFQSLVGGAKQADAALALIEGDGGAKYNQTMTAMQGNTHKLDTAFSTAMGSMSAKTGQLVAMIQNMAYQFLEAIKPQLTAFLTQLSGWVAILGQHMNIVMPIVAALAIALGVVLIAALAPLIAMLGGIIAAAGPFIVIGAAIGAAAVLIYQNWSRVAPVLAPLVSLFQSMIPVFQLVGAMIHNVFVGLVGDLGKVLGPAFLMVKQDMGLLTEAWQRFSSAIPSAVAGLKIIGAILGGLVAISISMTIALISGLITAFGYLLSGVITVITGIMTYFLGLYQFFVGLWSFIIDLFTGNWGKLGTDLQNMGKGILTMFEGLMMMLVGLIQAVLGTILGFVVGFVTGFISFFVSLYNAIVGHSIVPDMVNGILQWFATLFSSALASLTGWVGSVISWFANLGSQAIAAITSMVSSLLALLGNLWTQGVAKVQSLASGIMNVLASLPGKALTWGADMISSFISGIQSMVGSLMSTVGNIAGTVAHFLGFSKPDMGPLARSDEWMPDFGTLLEQGLLSNVPKLRNASQQIALALSHGISMPQGATPTLTATAGTNATTGFLAQILATLQQQGRSQTGAPLTTNALTQQIGSVNFHGIRDLQSAYAQFNAFSGLAFEYGSRGASAGMPL